MPAPFPLNITLTSHPRCPTCTGSLHPLWTSFINSCAVCDPCLQRYEDGPDERYHTPYRVQALATNPARRWQPMDHDLAYYLEPKPTVSQRWDLRIAVPEGAVCLICAGAFDVNQQTSFDGGSIFFLHNVAIHLHHVDHRYRLEIGPDDPELAASRTNEREVWANHVPQHDVSKSPAGARHDLTFLNFQLGALRHGYRTIERAKNLAFWTPLPMETADTSAAWLEFIGREPVKLAQAARSRLPIPYTWQSNRQLEHSTQSSRPSPNCSTSPH